MENQPRAEGKTPLHLWIVGGVSLIWNAIGAVDYVMTKTQNAAYLSGFTEEQLAYFNSYPFMANIGWALGVWGAVAGSVLLLARSRYARQGFALSLVGAVLTMVYSYVLSDGLGMMGVGGLIFSLVILASVFALLVYSNTMARSGVLR